MSCSTVWQSSRGGGRAVYSQIPEKVRMSCYVFSISSNTILGKQCYVFNRIPYWFGAFFAKSHFPPLASWRRVCAPKLITVYRNVNSVITLPYVGQTTAAVAFTQHLREASLSYFQLCIKLPFLSPITLP